MELIQGHTVVVKIKETLLLRDPTRCSPRRHLVHVLSWS